MKIIIIYNTLFNINNKIVIELLEGVAQDQSFSFLAPQIHHHYLNQIDRQAYGAS